MNILDLNNDMLNKILEKIPNHKLIIFYKLNKKSYKINKINIKKIYLYSAIKIWYFIQINLNYKIFINKLKSQIYKMIYFPYYQTNSNSCVWYCPYIEMGICRFCGEKLNKHKIKSTTINYLIKKNILDLDYVRNN